MAGTAFAGHSGVVGLVLTGGGARAAYQVGALRALAEILKVASPFGVFVGASAGAINSTVIAADCDDFPRAATRLGAGWASLTPERIYRTDVRSLGVIGTRWIAQLGGLTWPHEMSALLDTAPLRALLDEWLSIERVRAQIASGRLAGVAVTATSYWTGTAITFFDGAPAIEPWVRSGRFGQRTPLTVEHVLASASIPVFFPPVPLDGTDFGDGCVRLTAPLSPAIHLGADRVVAIGIRYLRNAAETLELNQPRGHHEAHLAEIGGVLLNAVFLDSLDADVERLERINTTLSLMSRAQHARHPHRLRPIPLLVLRPSRDLAEVASAEHGRLPLALRYLLRGIGASGRRGWELVSYLAFDPAYIARLMELGYADTLARRGEVADFFAGESL